MLPTNTVPLLPMAICRAFFTPCAQMLMVNPSGSLMVSSRSTVDEDFACCA